MNCPHCGTGYDGLSVNVTSGACRAMVDGTFLACVDCGTPLVMRSATLRRATEGDMARLTLKSRRRVALQSLVVRRSESDDPMELRDEVLAAWRAAGIARS